MRTQRRTVLKAMGAGAMMAAMGGFAAEAQDGATVFELRIYHTVEGRLPALLARFRDHTVTLFTKHGIVSVAYWVPTDEPLKDKTLIYVLKHPSRDEATKNWKAFQDDPDWIKVKAESEASGKIVEKIDSSFMTMTDFSPKV
jgi:NIPSNAP